MTTAAIIAILCAVGVLLLFFVPRRAQDRALAVASLVGFIAFVAVVAVFVGEPDLIIVFVIGGGLAAYDFWRTARGTNGTDGRG